MRPPSGKLRPPSGRTSIDPANHQRQEYAMGSSFKSANPNFMISAGLNEGSQSLGKSPSGSGLLNSSTKYNGGASSSKTKRPTSGTLRKAALRAAGID